ncbi:MAG TPA: TOPRIM nucleotidyl transferase/hydrolase domain-containing protein [Ilumatobacteraceae bacterium]|nr:TOPRIM nucleotidyl transferase/hydrolase domain-containing protein [Ilumatobacteraceae bacterium]
MNDVAVDGINDARTIVLVEGASDRIALETLASRRGRDLASEGVQLLAMGGSKSAGTFLDRFGPKGLDKRVAGLCDAAEERDFQRGVHRSGLGNDPTRAEMEVLGFFVCVLDLEDELIRALGVDAVEAVVEDQGDLASLRIFQKQPAQRGRSPEAQLRRFMGTRSGRKVNYARLLVEALDLECVPRPLDRLLAHL